MCVYVKNFGVKKSFGGMRHGCCGRPGGGRGTGSAGCTRHKPQSGGAAGLSPGAVREAAATGAETHLRDRGWPKLGQGHSDGRQWHGCETLHLPWPGVWCCLQLSTNQFCRWLSWRTLVGWKWETGDMAPEDSWQGENYTQELNLRKTACWQDDRSVSQRRTWNKK